MNVNYRHIEDKILWNLVGSEDDSLAFGELHRRYAAKMYTLARRKLDDQAAAEDLVQELFVSFWLKRKEIRIEKDIDVYLFTSLRNRIISSLRKKLYEKSVSLHDIPDQTLASHSANPVQEEILLSELQVAYDRELGKLPEKSRRVFQLSRSGLTNRETAELLEITEKTVEFHISKALRILREKLNYLALIVALLSS
ncbi:RNA polymerase sigma-70 factor [Salmonirosea aquatica]|uniref:RNA polymerase sigma-70 factor n=1 Tax=Salmonirosea aquatica TaxID=2654236 RepID=A0A7C9FPB1_9BACT|nr:RNA polymerase sigma-70 factor [Cytophagaceae bacterium SJW1-29]